MKNFRKVLALILVVATLFSFAAMIGAREVGDYTDYDKVSYQEAVDVLTAIGILDGYTDGSFKPADSIAREEMAKMVAVLSNAGDDISDLYASACKFADTKDRWSASYVAYCNETGIVAGRNATTFDPRGNVTGLETAKMLLCVLGFDATTQGYVGASWKTNVLRDAKNFGLLDNFAADYDPAKAITREEAAQMMMNALRANIVIGTVSNNLVKFSNALYIDKYGDLQITVTDAETYGWVVLYKNVVISWEPLASVYKGLSYSEGWDCYGNPGHMWRYENSKGTVLFDGFYVDAADYTYTKAATLTTDLKAEIDSSKDYRVVAFVDGVRQAGVTTANLGTFASNHTGYGVETKVYVMDNPTPPYWFDLPWTEDDGVIIITVKNTYIGQVADVNERNNTFDIVQKDGTVIANNVKGNATFGFEDGDMVLYWLCNGQTVTFEVNTAGDIEERYTSDNHNLGSVGAYDIHDVQLVEAVRSHVSYARYNVNPNSAANSEAYFTAEGKNSYYAKNFGVQYDTFVKVMNSAQVDDDCDVYYDLFGYVMYWEVSDDTPDYSYAYFVEDSWSGKFVETNQSGDVWSYTADYVDFSAKENNGAINERLKNQMQLAYEQPIGFWGATIERGAGLLAKYSVNADGTMEWARTARILSGRNVKMQLEAGSFIIADVREGFDAPLYAGNTTKFLVRTYNYNTAKYEYTAFTGYKNIDKDYGTNIMARQSYLQYFDENNDNIAEYVFIDAVYTSNADYFYLLGRAHDASWDKILSDYPDYEVYYGMVNGEPAYIAFDTVAHSDPGVGTNGSLIVNEAYGLYYGSMSVLGVDVGEVEGGGSVPLYIAVDAERPDYAGFAAQAIEITFNETEGLIGFKWPHDRDGYEYLEPADNFAMYNVVYKWNATTREYEYSSFVKTTNTKDYPVTAWGRIWVITNDAGQVEAIYREVR